MTRISRGDEGSVTTEMVMVVPVALVLLCLIALVGRTTTTRQTLDGAARDAARAASIQRNPSAARTAAVDAATTAVTQSGLRCVSRTVDVDTSRFGAGGQVTVRVGCEVSLGDLGPLGLPGTRHFDASATSVIDTYRATEPSP